MNVNNSTKPKLGLKDWKVETKNGPEMDTPKLRKPQTHDEQRDRLERRFVAEAFAEKRRTQFTFNDGSQVEGQIVDCGKFLIEHAAGIALSLQGQLGG